MIQRHPVTNRQFLAFLDDLVARGRQAEAALHVPRERSSTEGELGAMIYRFDGVRFSLRKDEDGDAWHPDWPVLMVNWHAACAWTAWWAERTGKPWRLPGDLEWEKAARGVDGRVYPWGDFLDPSWACVMEGHAGRRSPAPVHAHPVDCSPFGVFGMGGNAKQWCLDVHAPRPPTDGSRVLRPAPAPDAPPDAWRVVRGGSWDSSFRVSRAYNRYRIPPDHRLGQLGFRAAYRLDEGGDP